MGKTITNNDVNLNIASLDDLKKIKEKYNTETSKYKHKILVCAGAGCISSDCGAVRDAVIDEVKRQELEKEVLVYETGCMGTCAVGPVMLIMPERIFYTELDPEKAAKRLARALWRSTLFGGNIC